MTIPLWLAVAKTGSMERPVKTAAAEVGARAIKRSTLRPDASGRAGVAKEPTVPTDQAVAEVLRGQDTM